MAVGEHLGPLGGELVFWLFSVTPRSEPPRKDGISGIGAAASLPLTLVSTFGESGSLGSFWICSDRALLPAVAVEHGGLALGEDRGLVVLVLGRVGRSSTLGQVDPVGAGPAWDPAGRAAPTHLSPSCLAISPPAP